MSWFENLSLWSLLGQWLQKMIHRLFTLFMYRLNNFLLKTFPCIYPLGSSCISFPPTDIGFWNISAAGISLSGHFGPIMNSLTGSFSALYNKASTHITHCRNAPFSQNDSTVLHLPPIFTSTVPELGPSASQTAQTHADVFISFIWSLDLSHFYIWGDLLVYLAIVISDPLPPIVTCLRVTETQLK